MRARIVLVLRMTAAMALTVPIRPLPFTLRGGETVTVYEAVDADDAIDAAVGDGSDPFGAVCWPSSVAAANALLDLSAARGGLGGLRVLELGAGAGLASLAAHSKGAAVVATDASELSLRLLTAPAAGIGDRFAVRRLDLADAAAVRALGAFDVVVAADTLYDAALARATARAIHASRAPMRLVGDPGRSGGRRDFLSEYGALFPEDAAPAFSPIDVDTSALRLGRAAGGPGGAASYAFDGVCLVGFATS